MGNTKGSDKLPDTQTPLSIVQEQKEIKLPWGRLYSCIDKLKSVDLTENSVTLGREENCTIVVCKDNFVEDKMLNISRFHFTINRDEHTGLVYLKDRSKNGSYVNGDLVGTGKKNIIQHDDVLSVGFKGSLKLFVFKLLEIEENCKYLPIELKRKYKLSRLLGKGACGEVHLIFEKTTTKAYAVKKIKKGIYSSGSIHHLNHPVKIMNEVRILRSLSHPCVVQMKDIVETDTDVFIVLEYMAGGELTKRILSIQPMTELNIKIIFTQIVLAVEYLHENGITHRDLKPDNVLLATDAVETLVKVTDFGLSKFLNDYTVMDTICGTPTYVAPEIIDNSYTEYSNKVDVWSLGVILFYMLSKELPFRSPERATLNAMILKGRYNFSSRGWQGKSDLAKDLVRKMLIVEPKKRLNIHEVLQHPWIAKDNEVKSKVAELIKNDYSQSEYFIDDSENEDVSEREVFKRIKLDTTL